MQTFGKIFETIKIGPLHLKNRVMMAPCVTFFAKDGYVTDQMIDFYRARAKGGVSLIVIEATYTCLSGRPRRLFLFEDKYVQGLARLVDAIHEEGALAALQLNPSAGKAQENEPIYVSLPNHPPSGARELSREEIETITREFGDGCRRAYEANFDAIQIHGASGYLVYQFLSPLTNRRKDTYGGTFENRVKFGLELVHQAKERGGREKALLFRLCSDDYMAGGFGLSEAKLFARLLEKAGVDSIDVTTGTTETSEFLRPGMQFPLGNNVPNGEAIREVVSIPVSVAGSINSPFLAEEILKRKKIDIIALGRPLIADPFFVQKTAEGKVSDICKCILCNQGCTEYPMMKKTPLMCTVNPQVGSEKAFPTLKAGKHREVMIIGGGPAGMVAAITAAKRGHRVTLLEKAFHLGGNLSAASSIFFKKEIRELKKYLVTEVERSSVRIELGEEANSSIIKRGSPEILILATGTVPAMPTIKGVDGKNVTHVADVLSGRSETGRRVIVVGGGMMGCETAVFLKGRGKEVILVDIHGLDRLGLGMESRLRQWFLLTLWPRMGIPFYAYTKVEEVKEEGLVVRDQKWGGRFLLLEGGTIVFGLGLKVDTKLNSLWGSGIAGEIHRIGDCVRPRSILEAIHEGYRIAAAI